MRYFCLYAGRASLSITVPCMPLSAIDVTEKRCALILGSVTNNPCSRCSARILGSSNVGTRVSPMPVIASGKPGWSPSTS